jgi:hypothetical protein
MSFCASSATTDKSEFVSPYCCTTKMALLVLIEANSFINIRTTLLRTTFERQPNLTQYILVHITVAINNHFTTSGGIM